MDSSRSSRKLCVNCNTRAYSEHAKGEKLCHNCLKALHRKNCSYCAIDFHQLAKDSNQRTPMCLQCTENVAKFGLPKKCALCTQLSAFDGTGKCFSCLKAEKQYGEPTPCESCGVKAAFAKPAEVLHKVGGKRLCVLCTRKYKREHHGASTTAVRKRSPPLAPLPEMVEKRAKVDSRVTELSQQLSETLSRLAEVQQSNALLRSQRSDAEAKVTEHQRKAQASQKETLEVKAAMSTAEVLSRKRLEEERRDFTQQLTTLQQSLKEARDELKKLREDNEILRRGLSDAGISASALLLRDRPKF